jgi:diphosphomevalonate decarboxylase
MQLISEASASPNIAFIKYWGNRDDILRIPVNGSISMTLSGLVTNTSITIDTSYDSDNALINGKQASQDSLSRISSFLDVLRKYFNRSEYCRIESSNNFPSGAGIASSASAFSALAAAYIGALKESVTEQGLSILARQGSGSASRSVFGGFVEWKAGVTSSDSVAIQIAPPSHWALVDLIAVVDYAHKTIGSSAGHQLAMSSPVQKARVESSDLRLTRCRNAILSKNFKDLAEISEADSNLMHAVMMTSSPPLLYWQPATIAIMHAVQNWRKEGLPVFYTIDAGPNVHCITTEEHYKTVITEISTLPGIKEIITSRPGSGIHSSWNKLIKH